MCTVAVNARGYSRGDPPSPKVSEDESARQNGTSLLREDATNAR
jgi:hypothetical protein